jgi:hypothetical protein
MDKVHKHSNPEGYVVLTKSNAVYIFSENPKTNANVYSVCIQSISRGRIFLVMPLASRIACVPRIVTEINHLNIIQRFFFAEKKTGGRIEPVSLLLVT